MNFKESKPIYLQIADRIMDEILQDIYPEEARIPSVREYAATVEVNANTVVRSYDYLQTQEIIFNRRGIGYFVSNGAKMPFWPCAARCFSTKNCRKCSGKSACSTFQWKKSPNFSTRQKKKTANSVAKTCTFASIQLNIQLISDTQL